MLPLLTDELLLLGLLLLTEEELLVVVDLDGLDETELLLVLLPEDLTVVPLELLVAGVVLLTVPLVELLVCGVLLTVVPLLEFLVFGEVVTVLLLRLVVVPEDLTVLPERTVPLVPSEERTAEF